jgi:hypothetical protein
MTVFIAVMRVRRDGKCTAMPMRKHLSFMMKISKV